MSSLWYSEVGVGVVVVCTVGTTEWQQHYLKMMQRKGSRKDVPIVVVGYEQSCQSGSSITI